MTASASPWPDGFPRVPDAPWARAEPDDLARKYDSVEQHGWYDNLDLTVDQLAEWIEDGYLVLDYSGGTGILADRLRRRLPDRSFGVLIVDSSPKFLRMALRKLGDDPRVAFRLIRYLEEARRLELIEEVVEDVLLDRGLDGLVSTNAVHLYYDLPETLASWQRALRPGGRAFVQSGNIRNPDAPAGEWIIDETVDHIHERAVRIVQTDDAWARHRPGLEDGKRRERYDALRRKYFLPVRPLSHYLDALDAAGLPVEVVERRAIPARATEWYEFLATYHEGVLGWVGGVEKVEGTPPSASDVEDRLRLMRIALDAVLEGRDTFLASWTYVVCRRA